MFSVRLYSSKPGTPLQRAPGPACDQCRRSKAKCNRQRPCLTCARRHITCCYDAIPKARGRRVRNRPRTESSDSRAASMSTSDIMLWGADASLSTTDAALENLGRASTSPQPQPLTDELHLVPAQIMDPEYINECSTSPGSAEADTSCDATSPISLQRLLAVDSCLGEDAPTPEHLQFDSSDSGVWTSSNGVEPSLQPPLVMLPRSIFLPYVHIFFQRLYPVFPVIDKKSLLNLLQPDEHKEQPLPTGLYSFLAALSAAVIVQLNFADLDNLEAQSSIFDCVANGPRPSPDPRPAFSAEFFISQCMQARQQRDFIEDPDEWTVLTSFFLFAYHGNLSQSQSAWYYLREAIGFIEALGLDDASTYTSLDLETTQRRCRIFWLLFITERSVASLFILTPSTV